MLFSAVVIMLWSLLKLQEDIYPTAAISALNKQLPAVEEILLT